MAMQVTVTGHVDAPAEDVYDILRNYGHHHPEILPKNFFGTLTVQEGGIGEGTFFLLEMNVFGRKRVMRMRVDEPEPGRVLRETDVDDGTVTTFVVEPEGEDRSVVTIQTEWQPATGFASIVDRGIKPRVMRRLYRDELQNLDEYARRIAVPDSS